MSKRLLSWDGTPHGTATWWHEDGDGQWAVEVVQNVTDLLDANKETQSHYDTRWADRSAKLVARIPHIIIEKWRAELGVDYWNPDHQKKVDELLNSNEWKWLRTDESTL